MGIWLSEGVVKRFVRWGCYDVVFFSGPCSLTSELVSLAGGETKESPPASFRPSRLLRWLAHFITACFAHHLEWRACLQALVEAVGLTIWTCVW